MNVQTKNGGSNMKEFDSIIGYDGIKLELSRIADMLNNPNKYKKLGVRITRGLMIVGEEGLGKTLMANCLIKALNRNVYIIKMIWEFLVLKKLLIRLRKMAIQ